MHSQRQTAAVEDSPDELEDVGHGAQIAKLVYSKSKKGLAPSVLVISTTTRCRGNFHSSIVYRTNGLESSHMGATRVVFPRISLSRVPLRADRGGAPAHAPVLFCAAARPPVRGLSRALPAQPRRIALDGRGAAVAQHSGGVDTGDAQQGAPLEQPAPLLHRGLHQLLQRRIQQRRLRPHRPLHHPPRLPLWLPPRKIYNLLIMKIRTSTRTSHEHHTSSATLRSNISFSNEARAPLKSNVF